MKKIPIVLEQYKCEECDRKWYINTEDKKDNKMSCPYCCSEEGLIKRKFNMVIHNYQDYATEDEPTLIKELNNDGGDD